MRQKFPNYTGWTWVVQGVALVAGIVYAVMMIVGGTVGAGGLGTARDIALIVLGVQALVVALVAFALVAALAYGVYRLKLWLRDALRKLTAYARLGHGYVEQFSRKVAAPFIEAESKATQVKTIVRGVRQR